jgi:hypothetical protein
MVGTATATAAPPQSDPELLLIGDAAPPDVAGRWAGRQHRPAGRGVAANHLVPVLTAGGDPSAVDAAARRVRDERWLEIVAIQRMQERQARVLFTPDRRTTRLTNRLLPLLVRTGLLQWLQRGQYRQMSEGAVPVRLVV